MIDGQAEWHRRPAYRTLTRIHLKRRKQMYQTRGYPLDLDLRRSHRRAHRPVTERLLAWTLRRARRATDGPQTT